MKIFGLQKLALVDFPGRVSATVFTGGCNFRCPFCHNGELVVGLDAAEPLDEADVLGYLQKRRGLLDGVCVSGGEPLLQPDLPAFLAQLKNLGYCVKLDTNGFLPDRLRKVCTDGLVDYVAMDIKNSPVKYPLTAGVPGLDPAPVAESAAFLMGGSSGVDFEFRTTAVRELHDAADFDAIGRWLAGPEKYYIQSYVESDNVLEKRFTAWSKADLERFCGILSPFIPAVRLRGVD